MFQVKHYEQNQLYIVSIRGDISRATVAKINQHLKPLLISIENERQLKGLLLECSDVEFIDSAGIGMLCGKYVNLKKQRKAFALCSLKIDLIEVLHKLSLTEKIHFYPTVRDAIYSMGTTTIPEQPDETDEEIEPPQPVKLKKTKREVDIFNMKLGDW